ncbi:MAG: tetratricopeptide repeat protein, partial [Gammaproteobacteria bacterium]|nr:tetratricopeptide repeat protein [Gammaproteobacteria bacterium]
QMEATRRLGDLNLTAGQDQEIDIGPEAATGYYTEAIQLYTALLASNPDYADTDMILYQLASAYETIGEPDQALTTLDRLVAEYPDSRYFDEAQFRRGEILFVRKDYPGADSAYAAVIRDGESSPFYEQSLYKHGWTLFKRGRHEESLSSFLGLLDARLVDAGSGDVALTLEQMPRPERELLDDTLRVLAISFSYLDGQESLGGAMDARGDTPYEYLLYSGLGDLYLDKERYQDAAETYAAFVARAPIDDNAPALQQRVIDAYTLAKFPSLVLDAKRDYVELYGLDTEFWPNRMLMEWQPVIDQLKMHLTDLASYDHAKAQAEDDIEAYERAAGWYRRFIDYFPDDPDSGQRNFLLAQILYELGRYDEASAEYLRTAYDYGVHENAAEAGYAAILAAQKFEEGLTGDELVAWRAQSVEDSLRFAQTFPEHEQAAPVMTNAAEEFFRNGDLLRALEVSGLVVTLQPPASMELERTAWTVIAHSNFDLEQYASAEQAYQRLLTMPLAEEGDRAEFEDRIAASIYRQGEQAQAAGNVDLAVAEFLRVAAVQPESEFAPTAIYDAGALLIISLRWSEALDVLERFRMDYPDHPFNDDVTQKLAFAYMSAGMSGQAAAEYERIATLSGVDPELNREALWQAADLYGQQGAMADQRRVYAEIVERYPVPFDESIEARHKLAELAREADDWADRQKWLAAIVAADASAGVARNPRSMTLAAEAKLELAGPTRDAFMAVKLTAPLKESLKLKKERMETALAAYGQAADYGIASVTTAATYEIANLYYGLSQDLINSERPAELTAEELEQYEILLEEQAFPFEEQAIEIFESNAARSRDGVYDQWVRASFARLAELMPARYAKNERSENIVAALD